MPKTELEKLNVLRMSNVESNKITKECIRSAMILLLKEKALDKISITELTKKAGVSRTGYYRNYTCREDVLQDLLETMVDEIVQAIMAEGNNIDQCLILFQKSSEKAETFALLMKAKFGDVILSKITERILSLVPEENQKEQIRQIALCGCIYNILRIWIGNGMQKTPEEMASLYNEHIYSLFYP